MVRPPCCIEDYHKAEGMMKKGAWTAEEDEKLVAFIKKNQGHGSWRTLPKLAGLERCGKSCRLRWTNYLRPNIKRGNFSIDEERIIVHLHAMLGNKWSNIASHLPGRTDNEVKNHWNTHLKKRLTRMGIDPATHLPFNLFPTSHQFHNNPSTCMSDADWQKALLQHSLHVNSTIACHLVQWELARLEAEARQQIPSSHGPYIHNYCTSRLQQKVHQNPSPACNLNVPVAVANARAQPLYSQSLSNVLSSQFDNSQESNDKQTGNNMLSPSQANGISPSSTGLQMLEHSPLSNEESEQLPEDCVLTGSTGTLDTCSSSNSLSSYMLCSQFDVPDDLLSLDLSSDESYNPACLSDPCKSSIVAFDDVLLAGRQESYWNRVLNFVDQATLEKL